MIGRLGDVKFQVSYLGDKQKILTFNDLSRNASVNYEEHQVKGRKPFLEFSSINLDTLSFSMILRRDLNRDIEKERAKLYSYLYNHLVLNFVLDGKKFIGNTVVIKSIGEKSKRIDNKGRVISYELNISLIEYSRDTRVSNIQKHGQTKKGTKRKKVNKNFNK